MSKDELPIIVRQAYQGWKNYFEEGPDINVLDPTYAEVNEFLKDHPHYMRNYWRNIDQVANAGGRSKLLIKFHQPFQSF